MAVLTINPDVENYIHEIDWEVGQTDFEEMRQQIVSLFEDGQLVILKNHPIKIDVDLLGSFEVPNTKRYRELSYKQLLFPKLWKARDRGVMFGTFGLDVAKYLRVRAEVLRVNQGLLRLLGIIFPSYRVEREQYSWRFLSTDYSVHPLHLDAFGSDEDRHYVRFFLNLDRAPRVWRVSHRLDEMIRRHYQERRWGRFTDMPANQFCDIVNDCFRENPQVPCHEVKFEQGDLWLLDTRTVPHGVLAGNRMVATHLWIDPQSMENPAKRLDARVAALHARLGGTAQAAE